MIEIQPNLLWLGNAHDVQNFEAIFDNGISAVVDVAYEEPATLLPRQLIYCRVPLNDGGGNEPNLILFAVETLLDLLKSEIPTLVACSAGLSRSPTIAAFALVFKLRSNRSYFQNWRNKTASNK